MNTPRLSLPDWLLRLESVSPQEISLGLERVERVLGRLDIGRPETVFHIAGTNGKGSSVAMLEALLRRSGARVGSYTSPHVRRYNERIRIAGTDAGDEQIVAAFEKVEAARGDEALTYFEYGTLAAMVVFDSADVDVVLLEVGMGGRLDAVNAIEPDAGLITNVALDHCDWLGEDVETIANEKAGIMRKDKPVVFGARQAPRSIAAAAAAVEAYLICLGREFDWSRNGEHWSWRGTRLRLDNLAMPALRGTHQLDNAAAVLALLEAAGQDALLQADTVNDCFASLSLEGRMQRIEGDARWLLDVAHNPAAATALANALRAQPERGRTVAVIAALDDKDVEGMVAPLAELVDRWVAVTAESPRAIDADELARRIANSTASACLVAGDVNDALSRAAELTAPGDTILITGSFYLVGPALTELYSRRRI